MDINKQEYLNNTELFLGVDYNSRLGLLAAKIAYHNFEWRYITLVMFYSVHVIGLQTFLENYNKTVIAKYGKFVPPYRTTVPQFVIFLESTSEISSTIRWLEKVKYDTSAKYVFVCSSEEQECDEKKIFKTILKHFIVNVILLKISSLSYQPQAFTYRIVAPGKCLNGEPEKMDLAADCFNETCFKGLFPERLSNFYKCRFVISTVDQPPFMYLRGPAAPKGTDADIMKLAADMLNATLVLKTPPGGTDFGHYINNNWTGSLGEVFNSRVHASVCTIPLTANKYGNFQISFSYYSMDMVWTAKLPPEQAAWEKLLRPLKIQIRIILLFTFVAVIVLNTFKNMNVLRKVRKALQMEPPKYNFLFYSWLLFLGMPVVRMPTKKSVQMAIYTWIWSCFVLRSAYQAALINSIKYPAYVDYINNFQEVLKLGYSYGGPNSIRDFYYGEKDIYDNWEQVKLERFYDTILAISNGETDFVLSANKEILKHHLKKENGTNKLQILPDKIVNSPTVVYMKKFSPLTSPLNYVLRVALEGGFVQRINERYLDRDGVLLQRFDTRRPAEPLSWYNFAGCFVILILGWIVSFVYFAVEYICGNLKDEEAN